MGLKFQNATPPAVFIRSHPNFMRALLAMGEHGLFFTFLGNRPSLNFLAAL